MTSNLAERLVEELMTG
jgi:predicted metalloprotease